MFDEVMQDTTAEIESETSFDYDNLFDLSEENSEEEAVEETTETEETEEESTEIKEETEEAAEETTEEEETVDFKYLGQTSKLNKSAIEKIGSGMGKNAEEVVSLLQKGANYEKRSSRAGDPQNAYRLHPGGRGREPFRRGGSAEGDPRDRRTAWACGERLPCHHQLR